MHFSAQRVNTNTDIKYNFNNRNKNPWVGQTPNSSFKCVKWEKLRKAVNKKEVHSSSVYCDS